ncbi:MAG: CPBP family glutamic-type intramembrane protease [Elusimicrobia bacterium]|nr:CPBP family glutamic-type intramembrane protease [Elusimicrobiota bacterium]
MRLSAAFSILFALASPTTAQMRTVEVAVPNAGDSAAAGAAQSAGAAISPQISVSPCPLTLTAPAIAPVTPVATIQTLPQVGHAAIALPSSSIAPLAQSSVRRDFAETAPAKTASLAEAAPASVAQAKAAPATVSAAPPSAAMTRGAFQLPAQKALPRFAAADPASTGVQARAPGQADNGRTLFDGDKQRADMEREPSIAVEGGAKPTSRPAALLASARAATVRVWNSLPLPKERDADEPYAWSKAKRWLTLAGLLSMLSVAPAAAFATIRAPFVPLSFGVGVLHSWPLLIAIAGAAALIGIPLRVFAHKLAPWTMKGKSPTDKMMDRAPLLLALQLLIGAAAEEYAFRGMVFPFASALLTAWLPIPAALTAGAFLSAFVFALIHRYGPVWTRVVGALLYTIAFVASGTLLLPILMHFFFNLNQLVKMRRMARTGETLA